MSKKEQERSLVLAQLLRSQGCRFRGLPKYYSKSKAPQGEKGYFARDERGDWCTLGETWTEAKLAARRGRLVLLPKPEPEPPEPLPEPAAPETPEQPTA